MYIYNNILRKDALTTFGFSLPTIREKYCKQYESFSIGIDNL